MRCDLGSIARVPVGEGRVVAVGARRLALFRARDGRVHVSQAECPHRKGPLADGLVGDDAVVCPLHAHRFSLTTGACLSGGCDAMRVYPASVDAHGHVWADLPEVADALEEDSR